MQKENTNNIKGRRGKKTQVRKKNCGNKKKNFSKAANSIIILAINITAIFTIQTVDLAAFLAVILAVTPTASFFCLNYLSGIYYSCWSCYCLCDYSSYYFGS